jgi:hypothetical protein
LLRSHAEILVQLETIDRAGGVDPHRWRPPAERSTTAISPRALPSDVQATVIRDVRGVDLDEVPQVVRLADTRPTLLAFLSSGCLTCASFFEDFAEAGRTRAAGFDLVVITKSREEENLTKLRGLSAPELLVVMSSETWETLEIPGSPYFLLVDPNSFEIVGGGSANNWGQIESLIEDAIGERGDAAEREVLAQPRTRAQRESDDLAAAGVGPDHPSLYRGAFGETAHSEPA